MRPLNVRVPKLCGADIELGNAIVGPTGSAESTARDGSGDRAARALLAEIDGLPLRHLARRYGRKEDPQDWGRRWLVNSGCIYCDLSHCEFCIPEVIDAADHVAAIRAMLAIVRRAQQAANAKLPEGQRVQVLVNNTDHQSHSWGSHLNLLTTRGTWERVVDPADPALHVLAAFQAASVVITGQGKVGSENGAPPVDYQLAQRADFFETLCGEQTTYRRPLVNTRRESLCGRRDDLARLHCIFFDSTLVPAATFLRIGTMQIVLAMIEADRIDARCMLARPLAAVRRWSHDPTLRARARTAGGAELTAVELQWRFAEQAERFVTAGECDGLVPRAATIVRLWTDTLAKLERRDFAALTGRLDWVLKRALLSAVLDEHPRLRWDAPALRHLDLLYASLDPDEGLYWAVERSGAIEPVVDPARIAELIDTPPADTRAWGRAMLLRSLDPATVVDVDWDAITVLPAHAGDPLRRLFLSDPLAFTRDAVQHHTAQWADDPQPAS
jgi:proteasome accessory factor A